MAQRLGESSFWVLTTLAAGRRHGYAIMRETADATSYVVQLKATTLYAVLERLEQDQLVEQDGEEVVEGRTRRYYRLTDVGRDRLLAETELLESTARAARRRLEQLRTTEGLA